jgi:diguanylate cyclase (GGDEF)-like protein/PAS domain S-box-containing protein
MADRSEMMEAALESFPEGLALLDPQGGVAFWNRAAENITGFPSIETMSRTVPWALEPLLAADPPEAPGEARSGRHPERGVLVETQHRYGSKLPLMMRTVLLRDPMGEHIGTAVIFHIAEHLDSLPHGESCEESNLEAAQAEIEEQAQSAFDDFTKRGTPLGLLWITVDQAHELRKTHGARACEMMIERIERTLTHGLRPAEQIGRWGDDEFLILSHEVSAGSLASHAQALVGLARTSDFRWWGDRLSLTVSIGVAQAAQTDTLPQLFESAQAAMLASVHAGGNHITLAPERSSCSPS